MKIIATLALGFFVFPSPAHAQGVITWLQSFLSFLNNTVIPFIIVLALLFFVWNAFRFFVVNGTSDEGQDNAKSLMVWGFFAFIIATGVMGLVWLLLNVSGFTRIDPICPDFNPDWDGESKDYLIEADSVNIFPNTTAPAPNTQPFDESN